MSQSNPIDLSQPADPFHVKPLTFEEMRARIAAHEDTAALKKHETWARMQRIREQAREAEGAEMNALRLELEPLNRLIAAMKAAIIEHHPTAVQPIFVQKGEPAMMVF